MELEIKKTRKIKIFYLPYEFLTQIILGFDQQDRIRIPRFAQLPRGFEIMDIFSCHERHALGFKIYHESFDEIFLGERYPEFIFNEFHFDLVQIKPVTNESS